MSATCLIRSVENRTDKVTSCDVAFLAKNKRPEPDLITEAQAARVEARAMPQGSELLRCKKPGLLRDAADSHGIIYAKRGEIHENLMGVVDSVWSKQHDCRTL
jgi:hypothetical protein